MDTEKQTYIVALQREEVETQGKSRSELNKIFSEQTQNVLVELKQAIKSEGIEDTRVLNSMDFLGMVVVESNPVAIEQVKKLDMVDSVMKNQRVELIHPVNPKRPGDYLGKK